MTEMPAWLREKVDGKSLIAERLQLALDCLSRPPEREWITRPALRGRPIAQFILPLRLCLPTNRTGRAGMAGQPWRIAKLKKEIAQRMRLQCTPRDKPLPGRPQVIAVRFSSVEPDRFADWGKIAIDVLCKRTAKHRNRLNILEDDRPRCAEVHQWWEYMPRGEGFVFLEVRA
jgi:hypothetical protein